MGGPGGDGDESDADDDSDGDADGESNETEDGAGADDDGESNETDEDAGADGANVIELGAEASGWVGRSPDDIAEEPNPTLSLEAGTTYELTWENADGEEHELIIEDADGEELEASDSSEETGETVTMSFDATEEMTQYYCEYHPDGMRGEISIDG